MNKPVTFILVVLAFLFASVVVVASVLARSLLSFVHRGDRKTAIDGREGDVIDGEYDVIYEK